jgi:hypothetical protein
MSEECGKASSPPQTPLLRLQRETTQIKLWTPKKIPHEEANDEWDLLLEAQFCFISWKFFDHEDDDKNTTNQNERMRHQLDVRQNLAQTPDLIVPFDRKKRVVYISHRWISWDPSPGWLSYLKTQVTTLSQQFDGFFVFNSCFCDWNQDLRQKQMDLLSIFISKCYVMVVNEIDVYRDRFWILWECLCAAKHRRLVINEYVEPLLAMAGTNPTLDKVRELLLAAKTSNPNQVREHLMENLERLYYKGAQYFVIPVQELNKHGWDSIQPVPLSLDQVNPSRIFMVSHRWLTPEHPDPQNTKLAMIRDFWRQSNGAYDYFFFDFLCIDQQKSITQSLVKIDELYAQSHCLCLCDGDYFDRSWCLFEMSINKFNVDSLTLVPDIMTSLTTTTGKDSNDTASLCPNAKNVLLWLQKARLVQRMGYVHALSQRTFPVEDGRCTATTTTLEIPSDQLHLKTQLRALFLNSRITNKGDQRIILNLLDKLIGIPS